MPVFRAYRNSRRFNQDMKSLKKGKGKGTGLTRDVDVFESDEYVNPLDSSPQVNSHSRIAF